MVLLYFIKKNIEIYNRVVGDKSWIFIIDNDFMTVLMEMSSILIKKFVPLNIKSLYSQKSTLLSC